MYMSLMADYGSLKSIGRVQLQFCWWLASVTAFAHGATGQSQLTGLCLNCGSARYYWYSVATSSPSMKKMLTSCCQLLLL